MNIINTPADLNSAPDNQEHRAFLQALLDDFTTFDDAEYPEAYQENNFGPEDEGYIEPVLRKVWNAGSAASWGFNTREEIEELLNQ